jgi:hypothetical protein
MYCPGWNLPDEWFAIFRTHDAERFDMAFPIHTDDGRSDYRHHIDDNRSAKSIILDDCVTAETAAALTESGLTQEKRFSYLNWAFRKRSLAYSGLAYRLSAWNNRRFCG